MLPIGLQCQLGTMWIFYQNKQATSIRSCKFSIKINKPH
jgi:hypothetical protein